MATLEPEMGVSASPHVFMGGSFDPIHWGHIRSALDVCQLLQLNQLHLMPCGMQSHREQSARSAQLRSQMVKLAIAPWPQLQVDEREVNHHKPSYTITSLQQLRAELGPQQPIVMVLGQDAFNAFHRWHQWELVLDYCHILVLARPGYEADLDLPLQALLNRCQTSTLSDLHQQAAGAIYTAHLTQVDISSSQLREQLSQGEKPLELPASVWDFITNNHEVRELYQLA